MAYRAAEVSGSINRIFCQDGSIGPIQHSGIPGIRQILFRPVRTRTLKNGELDLLEAHLQPDHGRIRQSLKRL